MRIGQIDIAKAQRPDVAAASTKPLSAPERGATMARQAAKLVSALEAEAHAHQQLVNIGDELKTVYMAGQEPDEDELQRLEQAHDALLGAAKAVHAAAYDELALRQRKLCVA
jgi:cell fate (sporulation/competence/biofilm development) regulator YlbF (YheA/YmcA/DUF963 family)